MKDLVGSYGSSMYILARMHAYCKQASFGSQDQRDDDDGSI